MHRPRLVTALLPFGPCPWEVGQSARAWLEVVYLGYLFSLLRVDAV